MQVAGRAKPSVLFVNVSLLFRRPSSSSSSSAPALSIVGGSSARPLASAAACAHDGGLSQHDHGCFQGAERMRVGAASGGGSGEDESQLCGRGDKRTKRGKRFKGTFGNCRHRKNWNTQRLREKWEAPASPAPGSLLPHPFPPLLARF